MSKKLVIKNLLREAVGVPSDIEMLTSSFTEVVKKLLASYKSSGQPLNTIEIDVVDHGESEMRTGDLSIDGDKSWEMIQDTKDFDEEKWKKFPMYKNPITIEFKILEDGILEDKYGAPVSVDASHSFNSDDLKDGDTFDASQLSFTMMMEDKVWDNLELLSPVLDSVISHEILHAYQVYKRYKKDKTVGFGKPQLTNVLTNVIRIDFLPEWNNFLHLLYLTLTFERQARIPQASHILRREKIDSYDDFMKAIGKTSLFKEIEELRKFNADDIMESINKIGSIQDMLFKSTGQAQMKNIMFRWNDLLEKIKEKSKESGVTVDKIDAIPLRVRSNPKLFFEYFEKRFHRTADDMMRKLSRLYSIK